MLREPSRPRIRRFKLRFRSGSHSQPAAPIRSSLAPPRRQRWRRAWSCERLKPRPSKKRTVAISRRKGCSPTKLPPGSDPEDRRQHHQTGSPVAQWAHCTRGDDLRPWGAPLTKRASSSGTHLDALEVILRAVLRQRQTITFPLSHFRAEATKAPKPPSVVVNQTGVLLRRD